DGLTTHLKKSHINNILHYTDMEKETISQFISSIKTLRIRSLFKYKRDNINSPKNEFCILISEFSKSEFSNNFSVKQDKNSNIIIEDYGVLLPSKLNTSYTEKPILILVHGLASSCKIEKENYIEITKYLVPYFHVFVFDYLTINQPISVSGMLLAAKVKKLKEKYRNKKVYIIAHSMGGLVSRSAIEEHSAEVDYLIMAGTPNNGSLPGKLARLEKTTLFIANQCKIKFQDFYDLIYSNVKGLEDLSRKNSYIKKLNENKLFNPEKYYCIAGYAFPVGHIRILNRIKTDLVVSLHNMMLVNGRKIPNIKLGSWNHMNYFTKNFEKPLGEIINSLLMKKKV
ncbi:esterase/lipase family protein, partial [Lysinibacillus fusiformis]